MVYASPSAPTASRRCSSELLTPLSPIARITNDACVLHHSSAHHSSCTLPHGGVAACVFMKASTSVSRHRDAPTPACAWAQGTGGERRRESAVSAPSSPDAVERGWWFVATDPPTVCAACDPLLTQARPRDGVCTATR